MKWGVRKEEQTSERTSATAIAPLTEKQQKRVDKFLKTADVMETRISELKAENEQWAGTGNPAKKYMQYANNQAIKTYEDARKKAVKDAEDAQKGKKLTASQKKMLMGGLAVGAIYFGAKVGVAGDQSGAFNQFKVLGRARLQGKKGPFRTNPDLSKSMSADDLLTHVAKPVNPGYSKAGGKMNCRRCTYAYELRRRGHDVHATTSAVGWGQSESGVINATTPGSKKFYKALSVSQSVQQTQERNTAEAARKRGDTRESPLHKTLLKDLNGPALGATISSSRKVLDELAKQPEGARGEVLFKFGGFGHSMAYEVVGGKPHIFDSQKGTRYDSDHKVESKWDGFHSAEITRLDNANLDLNFLARWADNND